MEVESPPPPTPRVITIITYYTSQDHFIDPKSEQCVIDKLMRNFRFYKQTIDLYRVGYFISFCFNLKKCQFNKIFKSLLILKTIYLSKFQIKRKPCFSVLPLHYASKDMYHNLHRRNKVEVDPNFFSLYHTCHQTIISE